jgi:hypothetical protein
MKSDIPKEYIEIISDYQKQIEDMAKIIVDIFLEQPNEDGNYSHLITCNGDRKIRPGLLGHSCSCFPKMRHQLAVDKARLESHEGIFTMIEEAAKLAMPCPKK